jgi:N-acyl-D-aspartate/D-glutamate deacylase
MGDAATERAATNTEIAAMQAELAKSLRAGAIGFATSTFEMHNGAGGVPMPSRFADQKEMRALASTLGQERKGLFMLTKGNQTTVPFLESLAAENGRPMMIAAMQYNPADPDRVFNELGQIHEARERRRTVYAQVGCTPVTFDLRLTGVYMFEGLPSWKKVIPLYQDKAKLARAYADPEFRRAVKADLAVPGRLNQFSDQWDHLEIVQAAKPQHKALEMKNIGALAKAEGKHPLDWFLDFGIAEDFDSLFNIQIMNADDAQVKRLLVDPYSSIALSDAGAHLSLFCDAGFGLYLFGHWSRERGDLTLENAVHQVTGKPAAIYGIADRGRLAPGCWADLLLFDPKTVNHGPKEQARDLPAGALRLVRKAVGVHGVWVNGVQVADASGDLANSGRPGKVLRSFAN